MRKIQAQNVVITLDDNSVHVFTGVAFTKKQEMRRITDIKFSHPFDLADDCKIVKINRIKDKKVKK